MPLCHATLQAYDAANTAANQQGSLQACLRKALLEELLRAGTSTTALQAVLAGCAAAVLRVCQSLQGPLQQQLLQAALEAMQDVPELLLHSTRDFQLLQLAQGASRYDVQPQQARSELDWFQACPEAAVWWEAVNDMVDCQPVGSTALRGRNFT
jgi:hypothetical protein